MDIGTIISGIAAGVTYSLTSYAKKKDQPFDWSKFVTTLTIGAVAGISMGFLNMPIELAHAYIINLGAVPLIENIIKIIKRKIIDIYFIK